MTLPHIGDGLILVLAGGAAFIVLGVVVGAPIMKLCARDIAFTRHVLIAARDFLAGAVLMTVVSLAPNRFLGGPTSQLQTWLFFAAFPLVGCLISWELGRLGRRASFPGLGVGARVVWAVIVIGMALVMGGVVSMGTLV
jgi:hypothetical protein